MVALGDRSGRLSGRAPVLIAAAYAISLGAVVLIGWALDLRVVPRLLPGLAAMPLPTAAAFVLLGGALLTLPARSNSHGQILGAWGAAWAVAVLAVWSLARHVIGGKAGWASGFVPELAGEATRSGLRPMSVLTAASFLALAAAIMLHRTKHGLGRWAVQGLVILVLLVSTRALVEYVYRAQSVSFVGQSLALHTATGMIVLGLGVLGSRADFELTALVRRRSAGGMAARRLLPTVLGAPLLLGLLILHGELSGLYLRDMTLTLFTIAMCGLLLWLVWWAAHSIDNFDEQRQVAQRAEQASRRLSEFDPLTGLLNRRSFLTRCEQERQRAQREGRPLSCIMLDIDYFKKINDTYGHSVGDSVLRQLAAVFCEECRAVDLICRYGGEEFCILLPDTCEADAVAAAQRLRVRVGATEVKIPHRTIKVSSSLGVAEHLDPAWSSQALIDRADEALLVAKQTGRDRVIAASTLNDTKLVDERPFTRPLAGLLARDIMIPVATTVKASDTVRQAARCLLQLRLESAPVINAQGRLEGLVTDQDLMAAMIVPETALQPVSQFMHRTVVCFEETATADEIFRFLCRVAIPRVIVIREGVPVGVLSRTIILRWLSNAMAAGESAGTMNEGRTHADMSEVKSAIETLTRSAWRLSAIDRQSDAELAACVIGEASRLQELVEHLLSLCQQATLDREQPRDTVAGAHSFL